MIHSPSPPPLPPLTTITPRIPPYINHPAPRHQPHRHTLLLFFLLQLLLTLGVEEEDGGEEGKTPPLTPAPPPTLLFNFFLDCARARGSPPQPFSRSASP